MENILSVDLLNKVLKIRANATGEKNIREMISHAIFEAMPLDEPISTVVLAEEIEKHYSTENLKTRFDVSLLYWMGKNRLCVRFENKYVQHNRKTVLMAPVYLLNMMKTLEVQSLL
jgi:hypothetical protein